MTRDDLQYELEGHLDSIQFTYDQHFTVANFNRWLGRSIDFAIFFISAAVIVGEFVAQLHQGWLISLLLVVAGLSAFHRAMKPGEQEVRFRNSANAYLDLFKRKRDFLRLDLYDEELTDEKVRERYDQLFEEYLDLNRNAPDASSIWYNYMKYVKGEERMEEEIETTDSKRKAISGCNE